jgi:hypothetical protein
MLTYKDVEDMIKVLGYTSPWRYFNQVKTHIGKIKNTIEQSKLWNLYHEKSLQKHLYQIEYCVTGDKDPQEIIKQIKNENPS